MIDLSNLLFTVFLSRIVNVVVIVWRNTSKQTPFSYITPKKKKNKKKNLLDSLMLDSIHWPVVRQGRLVYT